MANKKTETMNAAKLLGQKRWKGIPATERTKAAKKAADARMSKIPAKKRAEIASKAGSSISPEAAKARAQKAWETKRKKLLQSQANEQQ